MAFYRAAIGGGGGGGQTASGSLTATTTLQNISCGFKPTQVCVYRTANQYQTAIYDENNSTTQYKLIQTSSGIGYANLGAGVLGFNITNDGFSMKCANSTVYTGAYNYFAMG